MSNQTSHSWLVEPIEQLLGYCRRNQWAGWDPYDGLNSPLFRLPLLQNRLCRLAFIQFCKRSPLNFRPLFRVPRQKNPKGLALFSSALLGLHRLGLAEGGETKQVLAELISASSSGWKFTCWGYNFDWQTRTYLVPRFTPNIICTTFAGNALLDAYEALGAEAYLTHARSAGQFLLETLNRTPGPAGFCLSYTPLDRSQIHNASLLGAAFLARLYRLTQNESLVSPALQAARFSVERQRKDGAWPYGEGPNQAWIDSFHTGYNLVALETLRENLPEATWITPSLRNGLDFFLARFFTPEGIVNYYHDRTYPIDIHALAQAVVTLVRLRHYAPDALALAGRVCKWTLAHMRTPCGVFIFQRHLFYKNPVAYMRWGQAWMLLAMVSLLEVLTPAAAPAAETAPPEPVPR
jgi:hypothetical protein